MPTLTELHISIVMYCRLHCSIVCFSRYEKCYYEMIEFARLHSNEKKLFQAEWNEISYMMVVRFDSFNSSQSLLAHFKDLIHPVRENKSCPIFLARCIWVGGGVTILLLKHESVFQILYVFFSSSYTMCYHSSVFKPSS